MVKKVIRERFETYYELGYSNYRIFLRQIWSFNNDLVAIKVLLCKGENDRKLR